MRPLFLTLMLLTSTAPAVSAASYRWEQLGSTEVLYLFKDGQHIGSYWVSGPRAGQYHSIIKGDLGPLATPPVQLPDDTPAATPNFGVEKEKIKEGPGNSINGKTATRGEVLNAIESGEIPDDAKKLRLTIIGPKELRDKVLADLSTSAFLAAWKDTLLVQDYAPEEWPVAASGFKTDGKPSIYLQAPDGRVLHRQDDYADGPAGLAAAIRKADPSYDPAKDSDLRKSTSPVSEVPVWAWALGGLGLFLVLKKEPSK